jgi:hypothetical protein
MSHGPLDILLRINVCLSKRYLRHTKSDSLVKSWPTSGNSKARLDYGLSFKRSVVGKTGDRHGNA